MKLASKLRTTCPGTIVVVLNRRNRFKLWHHDSTFLPSASAASKQESPAKGWTPAAAVRQTRSMALTPSTMPRLGTAAPDFALPDPTGRMVRRHDFQAAPGLLVMFICNHCPYVKHVREQLAQLGREYLEQGVAMVAINANDASRYPADSPANMAEEVTAAGYTFPYLYDETQAVARAYGAACTPDFFLFDRDRKLAYRGQLDDSRPGNGLPVTGRDLRAAMDALLAGRPIAPDQRPSMGCSIKWK